VFFFLSLHLFFLFLYGRSIPFLRQNGSSFSTQASTSPDFIHSHYFSILFPSFPKPNSLHGSPSIRVSFWVSRFLGTAWKRGNRGRTYFSASPYLAVPLSHPPIFFVLVARAHGTFSFLRGRTHEVGLCSSLPPFLLLRSGIPFPSIPLFYQRRAFSPQAFPSFRGHA